MSTDFENNANSDLPTVRIWYNEQPASFSSHRHSAMEVIIPIENYYDAVTPSGEYHLMPGDILVIPPGEPHQLSAPAAGARVIYQFDISMIRNMEGYSAFEPLFADSLLITKSACPQIYEEIYQLFMQMKTEYFSSNEFRELSIYGLLIHFFVLYGRNHLAGSSVFSNVRVYKQKEYMKKFNNVLDYIEAHYTEELTLDDVADFSGFSKYHFTRLFKQYTDSTFYEYLSCKRIKAAEQLLAEPNLSITEIALQAGFSSISTFNRSFRKLKHCTPTEYRMLCNKLHFKV